MQMKYIILQTYTTWIVWQSVRRITKEIWKWKGQV